MAPGFEICAATLIPESILLNCSLVITVSQESALVEVVFAEATSLGQTPWSVTTGAFGGTLSGLNDCWGKDGAGCWTAGRRESAATAERPMSERTHKFRPK